MANPNIYSDLLVRDHQIYHHERLKPHDLELNVKLPSLTDIIISPYIIIKKIVHLTKDRLDGKIEKLDVHSQITKHALLFVRSCLNIIQYLTWIGIFALEATTLSTTILTLTLCISTLGIAKTAISLIRQQHFIYRLNFNPIDQVRRVKDNYTLLSSLEKIVPDQMRERFARLSNDADKKTFLDELEHLLVMERLKKINDEFLTLSEQEKHEFKEVSVDHVKAIGLIQKKYVEKKRKLSERVHYICSVELCQKLPSLLKPQDQPQDQLDERVTSSLAQAVLTQPRSEPKPLTDRVISWIRNIPSKINNFFSALFSRKAPEVVKAPEVQLTEEQTCSLHWLNSHITAGISIIVDRCWIPGGVENLVRDEKLAECHKEDFLEELKNKLGIKLREMHKACNEELKDFILHPKPINELSDDAKFLLTILWADCSHGCSDSHKNALSSLMDVPEDMGKTMLHEQVDAKIKKFNLIQKNATQEVLDDFSKKDSEKDKVAAIALYNMIEKSSKLKRKILITNFFLYSVNIIISALSLSIQIPFVPSITAMGITTLISFINHLDIYGKLDTKQENFDFLNCLPKWAKSIYEKIFCEEKTNPPSIEHRVTVPVTKH